MFAKYICLNGSFLSSSEGILKADNRSFSYGDALFETIRAYGTDALYLEDHLERLFHGMRVLHMNIPDYFSTDFFRQQICKLLNKNRIFKAARIRLSIFRDSAGFYTPETNNVSFLIVTSELPETTYALNGNGYNLGLYSDIKKPLNVFSNLKSANALLFVMAGIFRKQHQLDDCLILNEKGFITESISSNVFILKDNTLITPALSEGCIAGTMRKRVIGLAQTYGLITKETEGIVEGDMLNADEVFLTNAIQGVRWILGYGPRRYYHKLAGRLTDSLNEQFKA